MTESFAAVFLETSPRVTEFGLNLLELNQSILVESSVALARTAELDDWVDYGIEGLNELQDAVDEMTDFDEEKQVLTVPGPVMFSVSGKIQEFFLDDNLDLWARFEAPKQKRGELNQRLTRRRTGETLFKVTPETRVLQFY